jgi:hypothetical protein
MCASPPSPRQAQPDWMGGGLVSRQMMQARSSVAMSIQAGGRSAAVLLKPHRGLFAMPLDLPRPQAPHMPPGCSQTRSD